MTNYTPPEGVQVPQISSSILYPYSEEFKEAYEEHFNTDVPFGMGMNKMLITMIETRKDYFVLSQQHSKTGNIVVFKFKIEVKNFKSIKGHINPINYFYVFDRVYIK